jgi:hypothetical protein
LKCSSGRLRRLKSHEMERKAPENKIEGETLWPPQPMQPAS